MPPLENVTAFAVAAAVLIAVPGPSVLFVIGRSLAFGRVGGILSVLGNATGVLTQIVLVALGVGTVIAQSALLFAMVKYLGAAYLIYLGIQAIRHRGDAARAVEEDSKDDSAPRLRRAPHGSGRMFTEGYIVGISNPKSIVFFVAVLPQFVDYSAGAVPLQLLVLGAVFAVIALVFDTSWAIAAAAARSWFAHNPRRMARLSVAGGAMMIGLGTVVAVTGQGQTKR